MRIVLAVIIAVALALPALAQRMGGGKQRNAKDQQSQSAEQQKKRREAEEGYQKALKSIPNQPPADPWRNVR